MPRISRLPIVSSSRRIAGNPQTRRSSNRLLVSAARTDAAVVARNDICWADLGPPAGRRPVCVLDT